MKKFFALCTSMLLICASFTGCGNDKNESSAENSMESSTATERVTEYTADTETSQSEPRNRKNGTDDKSNHGIIDGIESAGEDIIEGAGDTAEDIIDGITEDETTSSTDENSKKNR